MVFWFCFLLLVVWFGLFFFPIKHSKSIRFQYHFHSALAPGTGCGSHQVRSIHHPTKASWGAELFLI